MPRPSHGGPAPQDMSFFTCSFKDKNKFWKANSASRYTVTSLTDFQNVIEELNGISFRSNMLESHEEKMHRSSLNHSAGRLGAGR